ncbi:hypothetical protein GF406_00935 [candidate division KSB1 bacterium]|nr:hypothetical protein [candidate division KSB1 bacterium]
MSANIRTDIALMVSEGDLVIRGPVKGSLQALSRSTLTVQGPAELTWPSLLAVDTGGKNSATPLLSLEGESFIAGSVLLLDQPVPEESIGRNRITIGTGTTIHGLVYTSAWCDFRGRLHGCLACNATWFYRSPTTYINWLYNTTIDSHLLEEDFIIPMGYGGKERVLFELGVMGEGERVRE